MPAAIINADEVAAKLSGSFRTIAKLTGFSEATVTRAEVGVILKTCVARTNVAKPMAVEMNTRQRVLRKSQLDLSQGNGPESVTINSGIRGPAGRVWWRTANKKSGKPQFQLAGQMSDDAQTFTPSNRHFKFTNWLDIKEAANDYGTAMRRAFPLAQKSAGLARQGWVQIADDLSIPLEEIQGGGASSAAITKARSAIASNGRLYRNGIGTEQFEQNKSYLATLIYQVPYWPKIHMDTMLLGVIAGRTQYFAQNVAREVFASHSATIRAYPWLKLVGAEL